MKRALLYGTALAGAAASAGAAEASDGIKLEVGGFFKLTYQGVFDKKQEGHFGNHRTYDAFNHNAEVWFKGETTLDNGLTIGTRIELEAESTDDDDDIGDQIDMSYVYWQGGFGRVQIGSQDMAIANYCLLPPGATGNFSAFSPNSWGSNDPIGSNAACVDTQDNNQGIVYGTPNFSGIQLWVSYSPSNNAEKYSQLGVNGPGTPANPDGTAHHSVSAYATYSYAGDGWGIDWGGGGSWQLMFNGADGVNDGKTEEYQTGLNLTFGSFSVGGVMEYYNEGGVDNDAYVAGGGFAYTMDPFVFGLQGSHGHYDGTDAFSLTANPGGSRDLNRVIATLNYAMAPGVELDAEIGYTWFHDSGDAATEEQDHYNAFNVAIGSVFTF
jgi:hypothetical protein